MIDRGPGFPRILYLELWYSVEKYSIRRSLSAGSIRKQYISKLNYEIPVVQEIHISILEVQRWSCEFVFSYIYSIFLLGTEVCLFPFGIM
jgi:hypothetical protein